MAFSIPSTLEKMNSRDKDFRYMATADLEVELKKDTFKMDADSEKKLTTMVLKLLEDNSNQVQELAVKCLGPLSKRVKEAQLQDIVDNLCNHLLNDKKGAEELRDIANIGLKTVIGEIPADNATLSSLVIKRLTPRLMTGISSNAEKLDIISYCLEALNDLLSKFSSQMAADHEKLLKVVEPQLGSKRNATRKWAISCLGHLAVTVPDQMFSDLVKNLIKNIEDSSQKQEKLHTYMQAIEAISRSVGYRLGKFLPQIAPLIIKYVEDSKSGDELKEDCFQCCESLINRCPKEITPYLGKITDLCLVYIKHDPNYAEDDSEDMETDEQEEEEEEDEDEGGDEGDYSDDDDMSWKVRRSSTKCLSVMITTRPELLQELYSKVVPVLIARFREREENVKLDVFAAFIDVLKQTNALVKRNPELNSLSQPLRDLVPKVVQSITKQLKQKSVKTRSGAFGLLKELILVLKGSLAGHVNALVPGIQAALGDKSSNSTLKIDGLTFLRALMATHDPSVFQPHIKVLAPPMFKAVRDNYYRTSAEGLRACCELVRVLRPEGSSFNYKPFVPELFAATLEKLKVPDIDQEVKESAITCMGLIISTFGDELKSELPSVLNIFQDRLGNEITRLTTVNALHNIATSKLHPDLSPILGESIKILSSFLRQTNRQLKQSSLATLAVVIRNYGADKKATDLFKQLLTELAPLISDADLHLTHLALSICTSMLQVSPASAPLVASDALPKSLDLFKSNLLQGLALDSLLSMLGELVKINAKGTEFNTLLEKLLAIASGQQKDISRQVLSNIAKGVSALCLATDPKQRDATVSRFIKDLSKKEEWAKHLALYCLGEIGRKTDLANHADLQKSILSSFDSTNEETRQAASFALGNVAVGSLNKYLPEVLAEVKKSPGLRYLLLTSLKEIIVRQSTSTEGANQLKSHQKDLLPILFENCQNEEEGTRNVVAECLGKLALISPQDLVPSLVQKAASDQAFTRSTVVTALKFAIVEKSQPIDKLLHPDMSKFLELLNDKDLHVRKNTLLMLNYAAHNKPFLIRDVLPNILPNIFAESKVKPELIHEVDLGPFKYKVDDGLDVRKAAYDCMYTLVDSCLDRLNIPAFVTNLVDGLKDQNDVKPLAHLILIRLASVAGPALLEGLDQLVEPLRATIATKAKEGAIQQDVERNDELVRSALRAIYAISRIPNVENNIKWEEFLKTSVRVGEIGEKYALIKAEGEHSERSDAMDLS